MRKRSQEQTFSDQLGTGTDFLEVASCRIYASRCCGSSSIFVRRRKRPTRVTRGSFLTACLKWRPSSVVVIDRNLRTLMASLL
jgi:hypothetical protein